ncbi:MAG: RNA-binding protein [Calditrichaceae bacterium]|nr:RNA-binding protein [Calditrichia bacterium]NUQ41204.1 RNA-binding protein [Calditrichaceae bacterium]
MNIYVGNLSRQANEEDLREAFGAFGTVKSVNIIKDKFSGVSKGFGFVEIEAKSEAQAAIQELNGRELKGTRIVVNEARPKSDSRRSGGGGRW